jgi:hypothetical protein
MPRQVHRFGILVMAIALCGCVLTMVRPPKELPADGVVECTDTMAVPFSGALGLALLATVVLNFDKVIETVDNTGGPVIWIPLMTATFLYSLDAAVIGPRYVVECRDAKRRGAELARRKAEQAEARAKAGELWKLAAAAARSQDCATVLALDLKILELDVEFHAIVFARDVAIARCLTTRDAKCMHVAPDKD